MDWFIGELTAPDLTEEFLETLSSLAEVGLTVPRALEIFRARLGMGVRTYVARQGPRVVGTASLVIERKFIHQGGIVGHVEDVAVHRDFQKHGLGTALVKHAVAEARKLGCYKVILSCADDRVKFYEQLGFRRHDNGMRLDL